MKKLLLIFSLFIVSGFFYSQTKATSSIDQPDGSATFQYGNPAVNGKGIQIEWQDATLLPNPFTFNSVTLFFSLDNCVSETGHLYITDMAGTPQVLVDQTATETCTGTAPTAHTYTFTSTSTTTSKLQISFSATGSGTHFWANGTQTPPFTDTEDGKDFTGWFATPFYPEIFVNGAPSNAGYDIAFTSDFTNATTTPDFRSWVLKITAPQGMYNPYWDVKYKNASSTDWQYFDYFSLGHPLPSNLSNEEYPLVKNSALAAGNYQAIAELGSLAADNSGQVSFIATSSILNFTIATGTPILHPGTQGQPNGGLLNGQIWDDSFCKDVSFTVVGADFGKGLCQVFAFLFVPGQDVVNSFSTLQATMQVHAPFSYFYSVINSFENISTTTTPVTGLTLTVGSTSTPFHITTDIFSSSTLDHFTTSTSRGVIRTLIQYFLYIAFIGMIILEIRHLFKGKGGTAS